MNRHSDDHPGRNETRLKIMGLGERAGRKSYFPQLQERIRELEEKRAYLEAKSADLSKMIEELDGARREAEENERRFRDLANLLPQTVFETDLAGRVSFANRIAFDMFGIRPEDIARGLDCLDTLVPEDRDRARANMEKTLQGEDLGGQQYTALRTDDCVFPCIVYATAIHGDAGVLGMRGIVVDISDQIRLKEQKDLIEAQYRQSQKMEAVGLLAGGVAHDFNNFLCPILGYSEMLLQTLPADAASRKAIEAIHFSGLRARDLVRQLLAFSCKQTLEVKVVNLNRVILSFELLLRRMIREDVDIRLALFPALPSVRADVGQIEQVIMNLVVNAQDAMPQGGRITISTDIVRLKATHSPEHHGLQTDSYVAMIVADTGHGMDAQTRERIFDPFFTTKGKGKGTGLGLATVYGIVKQHHGAIEVHSEPGSGSTLKIYLPTTNESLAERDIASRVSGQCRGTETLLVAEDNEQVRNLVVTILEKEGYEVISGACGKDCLTGLANHNGALDLLVTDVIMPDMNGTMLYQQVAARYPGIQVLYMSGYTEDVIGHHGVLEEGIAFIQKPFSAAALIAKVRELLDKG